MSVPLRSTLMTPLHVGKKNMDVTTFEQDLLSLGELAKQIENFISIERQFVSGGLVLGILKCAKVFA